MYPWAFASKNNSAKEDDKNKEISSAVKPS